MAREIDWQLLIDRLRARDATLTNVIAVSASMKSMPAELFQELAQSKLVHTIHFQLMRISDDDCRMLQQVGLPESLTTLKLSHNHISSAGLPAISSVALSPTSVLTSLDLSSNPLRGDLVPLGRAVARSKLRSLNLSSTQCSETLLEMARALCDSDSGACPLRTLLAQGNEIGDEVAAGLVAPLASAGVRELFLGKNAIGDAGGAALAQGCAETDSRGVHRSPLRRLSLLGNNIGDAAACSFARALASNCPLQALNLSHNTIGDAGVEALADSVRFNARVTTLDVGVNAASKDVAKALSLLMSREATTRRQHRQFRSTALSLLLANRYPRAEEGEARSEQLLGRLSHAVLLSILELARPESFDATQMARARGAGRASAPGAQT